MLKTGSFALARLRQNICSPVVCRNLSVCLRPATEAPDMILWLWVRTPSQATLNSVLQMLKMDCYICCEVLELRELETIHATRDVDTGSRGDQIERTQWAIRSRAGVGRGTLKERHSFQCWSKLGSLLMGRITLPSPG